jgi:predicted nucleic acid-binding Zn ribbon protein
MQAMRDLLRTTLSRSLNTLSPLDRLGAAWPVAAGHAIAERSNVSDYEDRVATITVADTAWQRQLRSTAPQLQSELARISGVPLTDILFLLPADAADTIAARPAPAGADKSRKPRTRKPS